MPSSKRKASKQRAMSLTTDLSQTAARSTGKAAGKANAKTSRKHGRPAGSPTEAQTPRRTTRQRRERIFQWLFLVPAVVYMALFFGYPVVKNVVMSFQDYTTATFFTGEAPWVGLANYVTVLSSSLFSTSLLNTALFTVGSILGQFVIGLALAIFFQRKFPLNGILRSLLLLPWLLPLIVSS